MAVNLNKDAVYRSAKAQEKDYFLNDGGGLNLVVQKNGSKLWRFIYTFQGKRQKIAFGAYPETTLENARRQAEEARQQTSEGLNPTDLRKQTKQASKQQNENAQRIETGQPILNSFADIASQ